MHPRKQKKEGWFVGRGYRHFDHSISFETAKSLVSSSEKVEKHSFRPLLSYKKQERRFKGFKPDGSPNIKHKTRLICYASHRDAQIYAYYAQALEKQYSRLRGELDIDDCVLAYRPGKGCNVRMANAAFEKIKEHDECSVIAFDISAFFDSIDHKNLKKQWCRVLGKQTLPEDHYNMFVALTRFSRVDKDECLEALGIKDIQLKNSTEPLCSDKQFHQEICGRSGKRESLIITNSNGRNEKGGVNWKTYGIPQGTPISAILSNISMIDFDLDMKGIMRKIGGVYLRYSDDILVICPQEYEAYVEHVVAEKVQEQGSRLKINSDKTEIVRFKKSSENALDCTAEKNGVWVSGSIQYLGLNFNGIKKALRHSTIARYQRKVKYAVRNARRTAQFFKKDKIRSKKLYQKLTDIGSQSMPAYARRASKITGDKTAIKQLSTHKRELKKLIDIQNKKMKPKKP